MPFIPPEEVARAKEIDLYSYLRANEPQELVHFGGSTYCTREHDSLKISNGKWYWFSRGIGGRSALDYLIKVKEIPFTEAVAMILGKAAMLPPVKEEPASPKPKALVLPPRSSGDTQAVSYLIGRGIDKEVIDFCIRTGRLYESAPYHNVVFVGMDAGGKAKYASLRGTGSDFKGEAYGSDKHFSFSIPAKSESDVLHLFESAIDLLAYATLCKQEGIDWQRDHLLSLAGVYRPKAEPQESTMPMALTQYLKDHSGIWRIVLRLDNDYTGKIAARTIHSMLREEYHVTFGSPPNGAKDVNEYLCQRMGLAPNKKHERTFER